MNNRFSYKNQYIPGDYWAICDICKFRKRISQMKLMWDGRLVCEEDFEEKPIFVSPKPDGLPVPNSQPDVATDTFVATNDWVSEWE